MLNCDRLTDENKEFDEVLELVRDEKEQLEESLKSGDIDGRQAEDAWRELIQLLERKGLSEVMEAADTDNETIWIDEEEYYRVDSACGPKTYRAMSGEVSVERAVYRKKGEHNAPLVSPLEMRWGVVDGSWTPRAAEAMGHLSQKMPEDEAQETSQQLGCLPYSASSFARIGRTLGEVCQANVQSIDEALIEAADLPESAHSIAVSVDRVSLPLDESETPAWKNKRKADRDICYRMAWCATVSVCDGQGEPVWTRRLAEMPTEDAQDRLGERLARCVRPIKEEHSDLKIMCLSDGASEIADLLDEWIVSQAWSGDAHRLVDPWHLYSYLAAAAKAHYDDEDTACLQVQAWRLHLMNKPNEIDFIESQISMWEDRETIVDGEKPIEAALTYIEGRKPRMNYAPHRKAGRPVGTGHVEATCKSLVELRMKRNGMYWKPGGAEAILHLRSLAKSDGWDRGIEQVLETYTTDDPIHVRKRVA
jgi:hypothetical protein